MGLKKYFKIVYCRWFGLGTLEKYVISMDINFSFTMASIKHLDFFEHEGMDCDTVTTNTR